MLIVALLPSVAEAESPAPLDAADRALLDWLEPFGLPSAKGKRYVIVTPPRRLTFGTRFPSALMREGIVLKEARTSVTVSHGLWPVTYSTRHTDRQTAARVEPGDLARTVARRCRFKADPSQGRRQFPFTGHRLGWSPRVFQQLRPGAATELVLLARLARSAGRADLAAACLRQARGLDYATHAPRQDWVAKIKLRLAWVLLWEITASVARPQVSWSSIKARLQPFARHAPRAVKAAAAGLRRAIEEPAAPQVVALERCLVPLADPSLEAQLGELRDQTRQPRPLTGRWVQVAQTPWGPLTGVEGKLAARGIEAVPHLLPLLSDRRLTRTLRAQAASDDPAQHLLRVQDVALRVLGSIAAQRLRDPAAARRWWARVQAVGQVQLLAERAAKPGPYRFALLKRIRLLDPERAVAVTLRAIETRGPTVKLLKQLSTLPGEAVDDALRATVRDARAGCRARYVAAHALAGRGQSGWAVPVIEAIRRGERCAVALSGLGLLAKWGDARALARLTSALGQADPIVLRALLARFGATTRPNRADAIDGLLAAALSLDTLLPGRQRVLGRRLECPFAWEVAGHWLARRQRLRFPGPEASFRVRERARVAYLNRWRAARGLAAVSARALPPAPSLERDQRRTISATLLGASSERDAEAYLAGLSRAAIPAVEQVLDLGSLPTEVVAASQRWLQARASAVVEVWVRDPRGLLHQAEQKRLDSLRGRRLDGATIVALLTRQLASRRRGTFSLWFQRTAAGVTVRCELSDRPGGSRGRLDLYCLVRQGRRKLFQQTRGLRTWVALKPRTWVALARAVDVVLDAPRMREGEARIAIGWQ